MKFENTQVFNFQGALRGLRNPLQSWSKSDSFFGIDSTEYNDCDWEVAAEYVDANEKYDYDMQYDKFYEAQEKYGEWLIKNGVLKIQNDCFEHAYIGPKDLNLAQRMIKAGTSDRKFLRQIFISVDITAPIYVWKEIDTYKVGTVANSTSTMHKLASTPITLECFELDDFNSDIILYPGNGVQEDFTIKKMFQSVITYCESLRQKYLETKDTKYWKELIRLLPESWLQKRTWTANYEILRNIYFQRKNHRLTEWHQFCDWIETLPYSKQLIVYN